MKILRTPSLGSNFTGSYKKECTLIRNWRVFLKKTWHLCHLANVKITIAGPPGFRFFILNISAVSEFLISNGTSCILQK